MANFYALPFASQMIVWATRRRLAALRGDRPDHDVLHVFHMADWGALYTHLLALVETLVAAGPPDRIALHAVSCPCIAPHEARLLNALTHAQNGRRNDARACLRELMAPTAVRLMMPHISAIADGLGSQNLRFVHVAVSAVEPTGPSMAGDRRNVH